jgi:RNA polymerase primary sigma factor
MQNAHSEVFDIYLKDIQHSKVLPNEEELRLSRLIKKGDKIAEQKLVKANLRFVVNVAHNYLNQGICLEDLVSIGNIGLIKAARRFDGEKNFRFISYAVWWVRQAILEALAKQSRILKVPLNVITKLVSYKKVKEQFHRKYHRDPTDEELISILEIDSQHLLQLSSLDTRYVSLDSMTEDSVPLIQSLTYDDAENSDDETLRKSLRETFDEMMKTLSTNERIVLSEYFGFNEHHHNFTLQEIGQRMDLTRERVRQIKTKALNRLRKKMELDRMKHD